MTIELLAERSILREQVYLLRQGFDNIIEKVQNANIDTHDKMIVLGAITKELESVTDQWPLLKDTEYVKSLR